MGKRLAVKTDEEVKRNDEHLEWMRKCLNGCFLTVTQRMTTNKIPKPGRCYNLFCNLV